MSSTTMSSHRASLLTGLRTGGPRSVSNSGAYNLPQTAAIGSQFPRHGVSQLPNYSASRDQYDPAFMLKDNQSFPMSAPAHEAVFSPLPVQPQNKFALLQAQAQAQTQALHNVAMASMPTPHFLSPEQQALQFQLELLKMQALQQQQQNFQAHLIAQAQVQQQGLHRQRTESQAQLVPLSTSIRGRTVSSVNGSVASPVDSAKVSGKLNPNAATFTFVGNEVSNQPLKWRSLSSSTSSLGTIKHDAVASWRRPSTKVYTDLDQSPHKPTSPPPPALYVSTPEETSPAHSRSNTPPSRRNRPQPLNFVASRSIADKVEADAIEASVVKFPVDSPSSPSTPTSGSSLPSSAREEASRRLYEGLGIGRPGGAAASETTLRIMQPTRQPRGPPAGVDELGERNFASRIRRKAIGGLGVLLDARGRRSSMIGVEAF